jgi:hypothetical protein
VEKDAEMIQQQLWNGIMAGQPPDVPSGLNSSCRFLISSADNSASIEQSIQISLSASARPFSLVRISSQVHNRVDGLLVRHTAIMD